MADKQDSNLTGLRYAEEASLKVLPGSPVWHGLEPNSYNDFGGQLSLVARNPINAGRQRKKGSITDLDAAGGINQDLTPNNLTRLMQGFLFCDAREKVTTAGLNAVATVVTGVTAASDTFAAAAGLGGFLVGALVQSKGFGVPANNRINVVVSRTASTLVVDNALADEVAPPATATLRTVGHQLGAGTSSIAMNGSLVRLVDSATDMTTLGLIAGEWVYVGGDAAASEFDTNAGGWARISAIAAGYLEFDKVSWAASAETGTGKSIQLFFGTLLKNELGDLIKRRTYQIERTVGRDDDGVMSEYLVGAVCNEFSLNIEKASLANVDLSFVALDNEQRTGLQGVKAGDRPSLLSEAAFNTSSDVKRIKLGIAANDNALVSPLFAFTDTLSLTINNGVTPNKAIGVLGGFDTSVGTFEVGGSLTSYFANIEAVQAVRNNADVTLDILLLKQNEGLLFDVPLLSLGDGRLNVEQDSPIMIPLENNAAESKFGNTLTFMQFSYLPDKATA